MVIETTTEPQNRRIIYGYVEKFIEFKISWFSMRLVNHFNSTISVCVANDVIWSWSVGFGDR